MFTSVHSAVAKLSAKLAPRPTPSSAIRSRRENPTQLYKPKFRKRLVKRLQAIKARRTILDRIQGIGLRALGKTKLWRMPALRSPAPVGTTEAFDIPHTVVVEALETRSGQVVPRTRVYTYWDADPYAPDIVYDLHNAGSQDAQGSGNEADATASMFSGDSGNDQYLYDILTEIEEREYEGRASDEYEEWSSNREYEERANDDVYEERAGDTEYEEWANDYVYEEQPSDTDYEEWANDESKGETSRDNAHADRASDDDEYEGRASYNDYDRRASNTVDEDGVSTSSTTNQCSFPTRPSPVSAFFCPPVSASTLEPLTTFEDESGTSTPRYTPVLVHESESYEETLYSEFKAIFREM